MASIGFLKVEHQDRSSESRGHASDQTDDDLRSDDRRHRDGVLLVELDTSGIAHWRQVRHR